MPALILPPFDQSQPLLRGNLHGHSNHSDGLTSPQHVAKTYAKLGYDFTCISDHLWKKTNFSAETILETEHLNTPEFITIRSAELHCLGKKYDQANLWHILANGLPPDFTPAHDTETAPQIVQRAINAGAFVTIAHPEWYSMTNSEARTIAHAHSVEIYNHSCTISANRGSGIAIADFLLNEGVRINLTATDDSHFKPYDHGGGWVCVAAKNLDADDIITALKKGRYYSSSGAEIKSLALDAPPDAPLDHRRLSVHCSPAASIIVSAQGNLAINMQGANITHAEFDLSQLDSPYFRVTIRTAHGQMAWSNPYFFDDLEHL